MRSFIMKLHYLILALFWSIVSIYGQDAHSPSEAFILKAPNDPLPFAQTITGPEMKDILTVLASDEYEGRETGTPGNEKAAQFIADQLKSYGIPKIERLNGYYQKMIFTAESWNEVLLKVEDKAYRHLWEMYSFPNLNSQRPLQTIEEVVFLGFGIEDNNYNDYKGKNVSGKTILIFDGEPHKNGKSLITRSSALSDWTVDRQKKFIADFG